jgi:hypothetical protein
MSLDVQSGADGKTLYVDREDGERGSEAPFYVVYTDDAASNRWGFYCSNCDSFDNAMDAMGRIHCNDCSNYHKADEWDAAHE